MRDAGCGPTAQPHRSLGQSVAAAQVSGVEEGSQAEGLPHRMTLRPADPHTVMQAFSLGFFGYWAYDFVAAGLVSLAAVTIAGAVAALFYRD